VVDGAPTAINVPAGTTLDNLVTAVQPQLPAGLEAIIEQRRHCHHSEDGQWPSESSASPRWMPWRRRAFGFANTQDAIPFYDFVSSRSWKALIDAYLPDGFLDQLRCRDQVGPGSR